MRHIYIFLFAALFAIACSIETSCEDCLPPKTYSVTYDIWVWNNWEINVIEPEIKTDSSWWAFTAITKVEPDSVYHYQETIDVTYLMENMKAGQKAYFRCAIVYPDLRKEYSAIIDTLIK